MNAAIPAIETRGLTKYYGKARGIIDLDMRVEVGEIFGFLGPNGAGKTTTIRLLLDFIRPNKGRAQVLGMDAQRESVAVHRRLGNLPGEVSLYPNLTGAQVLEYSAHLHGGVPQKEIARLAARLDTDLTRPMKAYSHGNKQKIGLIQAMMHKPELLILDEPTTGLDPLVQQGLYELLEEVRNDGRTVFFSSHVLPEVERLCDRIAIVREGRLVAVETVAGLKQKAVRRIEITFDSPVHAGLFAALPGVVDAQAVGPTLFVTAVGELDALVKATALYKVINITTREPTLEEIFLTFYQGGGKRAV